MKPYRRSIGSGEDAPVCSLCGFRSTRPFPECGGCNLRRSCGIARCPNCGYQSIESSRLLTWLAGKYHRLAAWVGGDPGGGSR